MINIFGTIYGYDWYGWQLVETPAIFLPFVPDSPTASLFFVFVLLAFLIGKNWPLLESLAIVTLFKYGVWAVVMNFLVYFETGELEFIGLDAYFFSCWNGDSRTFICSILPILKLWHLIVTGIWTLHNDVIDYLFLYDSTL